MCGFTTNSISQAQESFWSSLKTAAADAAADTVQIAHASDKGSGPRIVGSASGLLQARACRLQMSSLALSLGRLCTLQGIVQAEGEDNSSRQQARVPSALAFLPTVQATSVRWSFASQSSATRRSCIVSRRARQTCSSRKLSPTARRQSSARSITLRPRPSLASSGFCTFFPGHMRGVGALHRTDKSIMTGSPEPKRNLSCGDTWLCQFQSIQPKLALP